jgi:hypothetical protein
MGAVFRLDADRPQLRHASLLLGEHGMEDRCRNAPMLIGIGRAFSRHTAIDDDDTLRVRNDVKRDRHFIGAIALVHLDTMNLEFDRAGLEHMKPCVSHRFLLQVRRLAVSLFSSVASMAVHRVPAALLMGRSIRHRRPRRRR